MTVSVEEYNKSLNIEWNGISQYMTTPLDKEFFKTTCAIETYAKKLEYMSKLKERK